MMEFRAREQEWDDKEPRCVRDWLARQEKLSSETGRVEDTLFRVHIYTDDPIFIIGVYKTLRAFHLSRDVTLLYLIA